MWKSAGSYVEAETAGRRYRQRRGDTFQITPSRCSFSPPDWRQCTISGLDNRCRINDLLYLTLQACLRKADEATAISG